MKPFIHPFHHCHGLVFVAVMVLQTGITRADTSTTTDLSEGADSIRYTRKHFDSLAGGSQNVHILDVDLDDPRVRLRFPYGGPLKTVSQHAAGVSGVKAAVNGAFFNSAGTLSYFRVGGINLSGEGNAHEHQAMVDDDYRTANSVSIQLRPAVGWAASNPVDNVLAGGPDLIRNGVKFTGYDLSDGFMSGRHPRTAAALTYDNHLLLVVVDGRSSASLGMTMPQLRDYIDGLGNICHAFNLDGGGSSTFWTTAGVMNVPSDGSQRAVSNAAAVAWVTPPPSDDIFWYAPGVADDSIWSGNPDDSFMGGIPVSIVGNYRPVVGDFNGNGREDIFWYGPGAAHDGMWRAKNPHDSGVNGWFETDYSVNVNGDYKPVAGDFNGDGKCDILWYGPGSEPDALWRGRATEVPGHEGETNAWFASVAVNDISGTYTPVAGDFNGDGRCDVLWYGPGSADDVMWMGSSGAQPFVTVAVEDIDGVYSPFAGDFDGDGCDDLFLYGPGAASDYLWSGRRTPGPTGYFDKGGHPVSVSGDYLPVCGDFDGDGLSDILWYGPGADHDSKWLARSGIKKTAGTNGWFSTGHPANVNGTYRPVVGKF